MARQVVVHRLQAIRPVRSGCLRPRSGIACPAAVTTDPLACAGWPSRACPSAYAAARDGIDAMLRDRGLRRTSPETTAESLLRGAHASAVLEGSASTLEEVRGG